MSEEYKKQATAAREYLTRIMVELEAVTKNLTACQELNTKQVMEIRSLRAELDQAKLPPVEGTIFEDRNKWMQRAIDAQTKVACLTKKLVPEFEWKNVRVGTGVVIHYTDLVGYHVEIRSKPESVELEACVWRYNDGAITQFDCCLGEDLDALKKHVRDVIVNEVIGEGDNAVQRDVSS